MAALAVVHGEGNPHMTNSAVITIDIIFHGKCLGTLLFDIKNFGMTGGTVNFKTVLLM